MDPQCDDDRVANDEHAPGLSTEYDLGSGDLICVDHIPSDVLLSAHHAESDEGLFPADGDGIMLIRSLLASSEQRMLSNGLNNNGTTLNGMSFEQERQHANHGGLLDDVEMTTDQAEPFGIQVEQDQDQGPTHPAEDYLSELYLPTSDEPDPTSSLTDSDPAAEQVAIQDKDQLSSPPDSPEFEFPSHKEEQEVMGGQAMPDSVGRGEEFDPELDLEPADSNPVGDLYQSLHPPSGHASIDQDNPIESLLQASELVDGGLASGSGLNSNLAASGGMNRVNCDELDSDDDLTPPPPSPGPGSVLGSTSGGVPGEGAVGARRITARRNLTGGRGAQSTASIQTPGGQKLKAKDLSRTQVVSSQMDTTSTPARANAGRKRKRSARSELEGNNSLDTPGAGPGPSSSATSRNRRNKAGTTPSSLEGKPVAQGSADSSMANTTLVVPSSPSSHPDPRTGILGGHDPKIARMFAATRGPNGSRIPEQSMSFSSITLLHGNVAQKTYGREKRFLNPPPVVRMAGSISDTVESISLQIVNRQHLEAGVNIPMVSNNQGVDFSGPERETEARQYLREGLYFPGLFAASTGTAKSFNLKLNVYQPGGTDARPGEEGDLGSSPSGGTMVLPHLASNGDSPPQLEDDEAHVEGRAEVDGRAERPIQTGHEAEDSAHHATLATLAAQTIVSSIEGIERLQQSVQEGYEYHSRDEVGAAEARLADDDPMEAPAVGNLEDQSASYLAASTALVDAVISPLAGGADVEDQVEETLMTGVETGSATVLPDTDASGELDHAPSGAKAMVRDIDPDALNDARPWAEFESESVAIISKPSKKTAKTKHVEGGLSVETPLAFWSRINQQAVRTKYMYVDDGKLQGRPCDWSAFAVDVVRKGGPVTDPGRVLLPRQNALTYGSTIILRDIHSGYRTEPLLLCKVSQGRLELDDYGPVIDMQRIALAKVVRGQGRWYLRAPGNDRPVKNEETGKPASRTRRRVKEEQVLNASVQKKWAPEFDLETLMQDGHQVVYAAPKVQLKRVNGVMRETEFIDDFISWTVASISEHNYTFFEGRHEVGDFTTVFKTALTPIPASIDKPVYRPGHNTLTMTVTNFLYDDDNPAFRKKPLLIYLGAIGPLAYRSYRSTAQRAATSNGKTKPHEQDDTYQYTRYPATPIDGGEEYHPEDRPHSAIPHDLPHVILVIHLPAPEDIWDATRIERERAEAAEQARKAKEAEEGSSETDVMDDDWTKYEEPDMPFAGRSLAAPLKKIIKVLLEGKAEENTSPQTPTLSLLEGEEETENDEPPVVETVLPEEPALPDAVEAQRSAIPGPSLEEANALETNHADALMPRDEYAAHDDYDHVDAASLDPTTGLRVDQAGSGQLEAVLDEDAYDANILRTFVGEVSPHVGEMFTVAALERAATNADILASAAMLEASAHDMGVEGHDMAEGGLGPEHDETYLQYHVPDNVFAGYDMGSHLPALDREQGGRLSKKRRPAGSERAQKLPKPPKTLKVRSTPKARPPVVKPTLGPSALGDLEAPALALSRKPFQGPLARKNTHRDNNPMNLENLGGNSSLPLLFVRASDGTGYHTGKNVVIERAQTEGEWVIRVPE